MIAHYIQTHENEPPVRIDIDLSLEEEAPQFERPLLLWIFVKMQSPDERGLCSGEECARLQEMREALSETLETELKARFSGSRMSEGWFELYFYARSAKKLIAAAGKAVSGFPGYTFDTGSSRDEEWEHYRNELYPEALMLHQIQSRQIIDDLSSAGDDIEREREVEHYLFFQLQSQADRAVEKLSAAGYSLKESVESEGEYPYGRVLVKLQSVTEEAMQESVAELLDVVYEEHGVYEGWSTTLAAD